MLDSVIGVDYHKVRVGPYIGPYIRPYIRGLIIRGGVVQLV